MKKIIIILMTIIALNGYQINKAEAKWTTPCEYLTGGRLYGYLPCIIFDGKLINYLGLTNNGLTSVLDKYKELNNIFGKLEEVIGIKSQVQGILNNLFNMGSSNSLKLFEDTKSLNLKNITTPETKNIKENETQIDNAYRIAAQDKTIQNQNTQNLYINAKALSIKAKSDIVKSKDIISELIEEAKTSKNMREDIIVGNKIKTQIIIALENRKSLLSTITLIKAGEKINITNNNVMER